MISFGDAAKRVVAESGQVLAKREECAAIADAMSRQNAALAAKLHKRSDRMYAYGDIEEAEQIEISAQALDDCATEARAIAERIRARGAHNTEQD